MPIVTTPPTSGSASGDLAGTYPAPTVRNVSLLTTKGDLLVRPTAAPATRLPVGANTFVLTADSAQANGVGWAQVQGTAIAGAPANNRKGLKGTGDWSSEPAAIQALARGFLGETFDIANANGAATFPAGSTNVALIGVPAGTTVTGAVTFVTAGSASITHAWYLLYDTSFNLIKQSADTPASFGVGAASTFVALTFTSTLAVAADTAYYLGALFVGASPSTLNDNIGTAAAVGAYSTNAMRGANQSGLSAPSNPLVPAAALASLKWFGWF